MFDFNWSEIALIGVVALVLIGPKDLPVAVRAVTDAIKKMRRMAGELQTHVDDMVRDADLQDARDTFRDLRGMNIRGQVMRAVDSDGAMRRTLTEKPLANANIMAGPSSAGTFTRTGPARLIPPPSPDAGGPPAFVPPHNARSPVTVEHEPASPAPAFIPPTAARPAPPADAST